MDFGAGPHLVDPATGEIRRTWAFVVTLCLSRHQYVEFVWDQSVHTWLGCHRRAFEWFGAVPARLIIDNAKCAITRACMHDPQVQRAYEMGRIADARGDSRQKRCNTAAKCGDWPKKLNRTRSRSSLRAGIHLKPRVTRGAMDMRFMTPDPDCWCVS